MKHLTLTTRNKMHCRAILDKAVEQQVDCNVSFQFPAAVITLCPIGDTQATGLICFARDSALWFADTGFAVLQGEI